MSRFHFVLLLSVPRAIYDVVPCFTWLQDVVVDREFRELSEELQARRPVIIVHGPVIGDYKLVVKTKPPGEAVMAKCLICILEH